MNTKNYQRRSKKRKRKLNYRRIFLFLLIICLFIFLFSKITAKKDTAGGSSSKFASSPVEPEKKPDTTIHIAAIGDIMCHGPNYQAAYVASEKTYDFTPFFRQITPHTSAADIAIGNLETTFAGSARGYSGYPTFNSPSQLGDAVKGMGIDVVSTANNHCMDKGYSGIVNTLKTLDEIGISHTGTYASAEAQKEILVKDVKGIQIAFLSFTYGTNGIAIPSDKSYSVNLIDKDLILSQIQAAKEKNIDLICVSMHWGIEYQTSPNAEQKELADFLFANDVDIILGSHPHVLQKMEKRTVTREDGSTKDGFVIYSLGNFFSNQKDTGTKDSVILDIQVTKSGETDKMSIDSVNFTPIYCHKGNNTYELIDLKKAVANGSTSKTLLDVYQSALDRINKTIIAQ